MRITRRSLMTGMVNTVDIPCTSQQILLLARDIPLEKAMPQLTKDEIMFMQTGITKEEWRKAFPGVRIDISDYLTKKENNGNNNTRSQEEF